MPRAAPANSSRGRHLYVPRKSSDESTPAPDPFDRQDRFAAYVAHELRTPIALQLALAEVALADPHADTVTLRAMCEDIVAGCEQQQRVIEALLDLTHSRRGLIGREPVDIAAITRQALQAHELSALHRVAALEPAFATGDPILLERLAANLISNAIRHNIRHGRIEVATRTEAGRAVLSVDNTGPLIPAGELTRLFQPFERLGSQPRTCADGIGLGLAIVQSIADAHNATVAAHARAGGGLAIEVRFPRA
jgi:signal transduction histidine kinase